MDGGWTTWGSYSPCTKSCGGGTHFRERSCTNPRPSHGGKMCVGNARQNHACNAAPCPTTPTTTTTTPKPTTTQGRHKALLIRIEVKSWQNLFLSYVNNKGADQPAHPRSLISTFVVRCLDSIIPLVSISELSSLVAAHAGLCLTWSQTPKTGFLVTRLKWTASSKLCDQVRLKPACSASEAS